MIIETEAQEGLIPRKETIQEQAERCRAQMVKRASNIERFLFLNALKVSNYKVFYYLLINYIQEFAPIVYTPTVGDVCLNYSNNHLFPDGLYLSKLHSRRIRKVLDNWPAKEVDIIVISDGSRILGLGDLGLNGMGIPVGKLSLYISCAGFDPKKTLPIIMDIGTNNEEFLNDPYYLGIKEPRLKAEKYNALMDEFMQEVTAKWPGVLVQFEDLATPYCFDFLERYRNRYLCFNDDIQGTGAVILSGFMNAHKVVNIELKDHRLVFFGAGSAATGVADEILKFFIKEGQMTEQQACGMFWLVDSKGLVTANRGDVLAAHKIPYARTDNGDLQISNLESTLRYVKPTALIGLSVQSGAFDQRILQLMAELNPTPIIFALSNPTSKSECTFREAFQYTDGKAIFASGSPFDPIHYNGKNFFPNQGNNMYIFPGLGLGASLAQSKIVTDSMVYAASRGLADCVTQDDLENRQLYPSLSKIRSISAEIATAVAEVAIKEGIAKNQAIFGLSKSELRNFIQEQMWIA